uniref:C-type lectin domain-containing protein n=1 Tax=Magallana gigas TaxID=29159 RepID=A0A8W8MBP6_MAGGI
MGTDYCRNLNASLIAIQSERMQDFLSSIVGKMDSDVKSAYIQGTFNTTHWVLDNQQLLPFTHWGSGEPRLQYPGFVNIKVSKVSGNYYWQTAKGLRPLRHVFCGIIV